MIADKRINTAQLFAVIFIVGTSLKMMMLPVLLLKSSGRDSVIALSAISITELICLAAIVAAVVLAPDVSFKDMLSATIGKWASRAVFVIMTLFFMTKLLLLSDEVRIFFSENLFEDNFDWTVFAVPFFGLCVVLGMGSARSLGRTAQFMFPFIAVATVLLMGLIVGGVDFTEVLPLGEFGAKNIANESVRYAMWYGDYSLLAVFLGSVKRTRATAVLSCVSGVIASAVVLLFMLGLTASFANVCNIIRFGQNVTSMSHYALGNIMEGRFDLVMFCLWMISVFIKAGLFSYAAVYCIRAAIPCNRAIPALCINAILYLVSVLVASATALHTFMANYFSIPALVFQFAVPALMLIVALVNRKKSPAEREGEKNEAQ